MIVVLHSDHGSHNNKPQNRVPFHFILCKLTFRNFQVELYDVRAIASSVFRVGNLLQYILQKLFIWHKFSCRESYLFMRHFPYGHFG